MDDSEFMKPKRKTNRRLLKYVSTLPCMACAKAPCGDPHHVTTVKAGGHDTWDNVMPLCREHHVLVHKEGWSKAIKKYPGIGMWLEGANRTDVFDRCRRVK